MEKHTLEFFDGSQFTGTLDVSEDKEILLIGCGMLGEIQVTATSARALATRILQLLAPKPNPTQR